ncbi:MAG TPA: hydantoinase/oxoprolinase family protein [Stellaceae bacterium]|nr:hydantoinase/oxoprolinase family protein [Stellaceae bacterium]
MTRYLAGADVGGTFTDIALYDAQTRSLTVTKLLTTPDDPRRAIVDGLAALHARAETVVHGTTLVTNALIERRGVPVGLITTDGYRDVLEIGNELRYDTFDLQMERPEPLVARKLRVPVKERIGADGSVVLPLDEAGVRDAARTLSATGVKSVAIAFFNSYRNPVHERRAVEIVRATCPDLAVCTSAEIAPEVREYERFSTAVANAYVAPIADRYLIELSRSLGVPLFIMLSDGGITTARAAAEQPIALVESGPAAGTMGAAFLAQQAGWSDVIAFDMGGTTAKISLIHGGLPRRSHELEAARLQRFKKGSGLPLRLPVIELIEIGAGGGSIAAVDDLSLLRVGPRSSGAVPGPACYGRGGAEPTVTDADLIRGYLAPDRFLGGRMKLDVTRAQDVIDRLARTLGLDRVEAANGIARVVDNNMATAARVHIAESGTDPLRYRMVAFGGAGPVHAYEIARLLNVRQVIFPRGAGVASAIGMLVAPRSVEYTRSLIQGVDHLDWDQVGAVIAELAERGRAVLREGGLEDRQIALELMADMRYVGQGFEVTVPLDATIPQRHDVTALRQAFERDYVLRFGRDLGGVPVEVVSWRVRMIAPPAVREVRFASEGMASGEALIERRLAYFEETGGFVDTPVYARARLGEGTAISGPALIEEAESTAVVGPSATVEVDRFGNLIMQVRHPTQLNGGSL